MLKNWNSIEDIFDMLNSSSIQYIVLRNYEELLGNDIFLEEHGDIDFLCDDLNAMITLLDAIPIYHYPNRNSYYINFCNQKLQVDIRYVGDGYYDTKWEKQLLSTRQLFQKNIYVVDSEIYFYSLIYHAIFQKYELSSEYLHRLKNMASQYGFDVYSQSDLESILFRYMEKNNYKFTYTKDVAIILNFRSVPKKLIKYSPMRIFSRYFLKLIITILEWKGKII